MADTGTPTLRVDDLIWSPAGENEWCIVVQVTNDATWKYIVTSTQTVVTAAAAMSTFPPAQKRFNSQPWPPIPPGPLTF